MNANTAAFLIGVKPQAQFYQPTFFDNSMRNKRTGKFCRVYNDGGHYVAVPLQQSLKRTARRGKNEKNAAREVFDDLYNCTLADGKNKAETRSFLEDNLCPFFEDETALDCFIAGNIKRKLNNAHKRKNRFRRKANLNRWTHFITITYSDDKHTEEQFRAKLRRCLSNFHTRRKWRYMGVFERAPQTGRLHFHALLYVPDGEMVGTICEVQDYSTKAHKLQTTYSNSFFEERFGRNDFKELNAAELKHGNAISYLLKYIEKTGERITYSRGIPAEIYTTVDNNDICAEMRNHVLKYVLFDDSFDFDRDIITYIAPYVRGFEPHYLN